MPYSTAQTTTGEGRFCFLYPIAGESKIGVDIGNNCVYIRYMEETPMKINWKAVSEERMKEAAIYGEGAITSINAGDAQQAFYRAIHAAHMAMLAVPELGQ